MYRDESHTNTEKEKRKNDGVLKKEGQGKTIKDDRQKNTDTERSKLFECHVTNQSEAVATDVLGKRVLLNGHNVCY